MAYGNAERQEDYRGKALSHQAIEIYRLRLLLCWGGLEAFGEEPPTLLFRFKESPTGDMFVFATAGEEADDVGESTGRRYRLE